MNTYTCPICQETMERDLILFIRHTDYHIRQEMTRLRHALRHRLAHRIYLFLKRTTHLSHLHAGLR